MDHPQYRMVTRIYDAPERRAYTFGNDYLGWRYKRRLYSDYYPVVARPFTYQSYGNPYFGRYLRDVQYYPSSDIARYTPRGW